MSITLEFVNQSTDTNNSQIVIFGDPSSGPEAAPGRGTEAPLLVQRVFALPPARQSVSFAHAGDNITVAIASAAAPGEILDPASSPGAPVRLALPDAPTATILVRGGGTIPITFALEPAAPKAGAADARGGVVARVLGALRRAWRMITGGR